LHCLGNLYPWIACQVTGSLTDSTQQQCPICTGDRGTVPVKRQKHAGNRPGQRLLSVLSATLAYIEELARHRFGNPASADLIATSKASRVGFDLALGTSGGQFGCGSLSTHSTIARSKRLHISPKHRLIRCLRRPFSSYYSNCAHQVNRVFPAADPPSGGVRSGSKSSRGRDPARAPR